MPKQIQLPDGTIGEFPDGMSDQDIAQVLTQQFPQSGLTPDAQNYRIGDPDTPPGRVEKFLGGAKHEWDKAALNLKRLVPGIELTDEDRQLLDQGAAFQDEAGGWATGGAMAADALATAPAGARLAGGLSKAGTRMFPRWAEAAARSGLTGGRLTGARMAGRGALEGGLAGAAFSNANEDRQGSDALIGAGIGAALPAALSKGGAALAGFGFSGMFPGGALAGPAGFHAIGDAVAAAQGGSKTAARRLRKALGQNVGEENLDTLAEMAAEAAPGMYSQTPASVTGSHGLAQLESQARKRSPSLFQDHDAQVAEQAYRDLIEGTAAADIFTGPMADAAKTVRGKFVLPGSETPITQNVVRTPDAVLPDIEPHVLRQTLAKQGPRMELGEQEVLGGLASELTDQNLYRSVGAGEPTDFAALRPPAAAAFSRIGGTRAVIDSLYRRADRVTKQQIDQAMADPQAFVDAVRMKSQTQPLTQTEQILLRAILAPAETMGGGQRPTDLANEQANYGVR